MADVTLTYKGATIAELSESGSKTLRTAGKYCEADIGVEYVKPSGGGYSASLVEQLVSGVLVDDMEFPSTQVKSIFSDTSGAVKISLPNLTTITGAGFARSGVEEISIANSESLTGVIGAATGLKRFFAPRVKSLNSRYFLSPCKALVSVYFPELESVPNYTMQGCSSLPYIVLPKCTSVGGNAFNGCWALAGADFSSSVDIWESAFQNSRVLETLVLRSSRVCALRSPTAFNSTPFASGGAGGTIYIPRALYDHLGDGSSLDYKSATNWSTYDGYGTITWAAIEGSIYETQYVDGTPIT